jgi:hypothetical protein
MGMAMVPMKLRETMVKVTIGIERRLQDFFLCIGSDDGHGLLTETRSLL